MPLRMEAACFSSTSILTPPIRSRSNLPGYHCRPIEKVHHGLSPVHAMEIRSIRYRKPPSLGLRHSAQSTVAVDAFAVHTPGVRMAWARGGAVTSARALDAPNT